MNLKILGLLLIYYFLIGTIILAVSSLVTTDASSNFSLNNTQINAPETDTGGLFSSGVSFSRFFTLILFGFGLPSDTPSIFVVIMVLIQTSITVFTVGFIISSIWNG
mgnify:CR=1 FL=1